MSTSSYFHIQVLQEGDQEAGFAGGRGGRRGDGGGARRQAQEEGQENFLEERISFVFPAEGFTGEQLRPCKTGDY